MGCNAVLSTLTQDLNDAIRNAERMAIAEGVSPHADHLRWTAEGLKQAQRILERACDEASQAPPRPLALPTPWWTLAWWGVTPRRTLWGRVRGWVGRILGRHIERNPDGQRLA